jgi:signal transduction protein with GAF and PtsI domain
MAAALTRRIVVCDDLLNDERYAPWRDAVAMSGLTRTIAVPLIWKDRLFGVLNAYAEQDTRFDESEAGLLEEFASDVALGLGVIAMEAGRTSAQQAIARLTRQNKMILSSSGDLIGSHSHSVMHHSRIDGNPYPEVDCPTEKALLDGLASRVIGEVFWRKNGTSLAVEYASNPILENGRITGEE